MPLFGHMGACIGLCFLYVQPNFPLEAEEMPYGCSGPPHLLGLRGLGQLGGRSLPPQRCPQLATNFSD